ncbi:MAG TPA: 50S ribosomal protein L16 [Flavobacterium sp.]
MLLSPKKIKFKKVRKGYLRRTSLISSNLLLGHYAIISIEHGYIHATQIEASRQTINRHIERKGRVWTTIFPDLGITKRPIQIRMGKGTGKIKYWVFKIRPGQIIFEIDGVPIKIALQALTSGAHKLPLKVKITT